MNGGKEWLCIKGHLLKINKWQAGIITEKVIQQLNAEPKVVISADRASCALTSKGDRNVPDLSHVSNNCSTIQDRSVYHIEYTNDPRASGNRKYGENTIEDIESELDKMFCLDNTPSTIKESSKVSIASNKPRNKSRKGKQNLNDLLIELFGSTLEDIVVDKHLSAKKDQPQRIQNRRHTLPVSINVPRELLSPLKVSQKRNSANDAGPTVCKAPRIEESVSTVCELSPIEFVVAELLIKEETITQRIKTVVVSSDLETGFVMDMPTTGVAETMQCGQVIDLTGEDSDSYELVISVSSEEVKTEPSSSSETAQVPGQSPSMPLLSPVSPAQPTQQATVPETSQRPPPSAQVKDVPRPSAVPSLSEALCHKPPAKRPCQEFQVPSNPLLSVRLPPKRPSQDSVQQTVPEARSHSSVPQSVAAASQLSMRPPTKHVSQDSVPRISEQSPVPGAPQPSSARSLATTSSPEQRNQQAIEATPTSHSAFSNHRKPQADKTSQQAPNLRQLMEKSATLPMPPQSGSRITNNQQSPQQSLQTTVSSILHTAQHQATIPQPQQMAYTPRMFPQPPPYAGVQRQNSAPSQLQSNQAPPLFRMLRPIPAQYEFLLISNASCGEKLVPHLLIKQRWKQSCLNFCRELQTYLAPNDFKQDYASFIAYTTQSLSIFGKRIIRDLSGVEVDNFSLSEVCTVIARRMGEESCSMSVYGVCISIHMMIRSCEKLCLTPFTKKFFHSVETAVQLMEKKSQGSQQQALFTISQLKQLEWQIQQCLCFQRWLDCANNSNRPSQTPRSNRAKKTHRRSSEPTPLIQTLQNTMMRAMLQHQSAPDRSGGSCDNPTHGDKTAVPSGNVPSVGRHEMAQTHQVPLRVVPFQPAEVPVEMVPPTASKETSVIVFSAAEEAPLVPAKTKQNGDSTDEDIIDLTWIDDGDEDVMLEEITESKAFPCKIENYSESETAVPREVVSPADSGLGSPRSQTDDYYKCLCGKQAIYVCACNSSMYCGKECQVNDWADHQRWCHEKSS